MGVKVEIMLANRTIILLLIPVRWILLIPAIVTTNVLGLLVAVPPIGFIYTLIMTIIWIPFYGYIIGTSWVYKKVPIIGFPLSLIGIPIVIVIDMLLLLVPNPDKEDEHNKNIICTSFPFSMPSQLVGKIIELG